MFLLSNDAFATVGGPTYLYDLKYDAQSRSVFYVSQDQGGRGCPPFLYSMSLDTGAEKTIYGCEDTKPGAIRNNEISAYTSSFSHLDAVDLKKNKVTVDLIQKGIEKSEDGYVMKVNVVANVYQNGVKKAEIPMTSCGAEYPFVIGGYGIQGINDKLALIFSGKSDCFEGGYTFEKLRIVGLQTMNGSYTNAPYKDNSALAPNEGNLVAYVREEAKTNVPSGTQNGMQDDTPSGTVGSTSVDENFSESTPKPILPTVALVGGILFILGVVVGRNFK